MYFKKKLGHDGSLFFQEIHSVMNRNEKMKTEIKMEMKTKGERV